MSNDVPSFDEPADSVFDRPRFEGRDCARCGAEADPDRLFCEHCIDQLGQALAWEARPNPVDITMYLSAIHLHEMPVSWWIENARGRSNRLVKMRPDTEGVVV